MRLLLLLVAVCCAPAWAETTAYVSHSGACTQQAPQGAYCTTFQGSLLDHEVTRIVLLEDITLNQGEWAHMRYVSYADVVISHSISALQLTPCCMRQACMRSCSCTAAQPTPRSCSCNRSLLHACNSHAARAMLILWIWSGTLQSLPCGTKLPSTSTSWWRP